MRGDSFKKFCEDINRQDILDLWDYDLNDKGPDEITKQTNEKMYFKCPRGLHESSKIIVATLTSQLMKGKEYKICKACNSIGQYIIDKYGEEFLHKIWSDKNTKSYFEISSGSATKFWIRCLDDSTHPDYDISGYNFKVSFVCPYCFGKRVCETNSLGYKHPEVIDLWSDKNELTPFDYTECSSNRVWFKCKEGLHDDYQRAIDDAKKLNYVCPVCGLLNKHIIKGEEHPNWKGGITLEVAKIRSSRQYARWREDSMKKDDYTCQCCGVRGGELNVHHIHDFANYPDLRLDIDNSITLCVKCHRNSNPDSLHNRYGTDGVTPQELEKYINERRIELGIYLPFSIDEYMKGNILTAEQAKRAKLFYGNMNFVPYCGIRSVPDDEVMVTDSKFVKIKPKFRVEEE